MNIAKFKKLEEVVNEFNMCWDEATRAEQTAREISLKQSNLKVMVLLQKSGKQSKRK